MQRVSERGILLIVGDQNARTGVRPDYPAGDLSGGERVFFLCPLARFEGMLIRKSMPMG